MKNILIHEPLVVGFIRSRTAKKERLETP